MLKSKIHMARVTATNLYYEGSLTLDARLAAAADLKPYEEVRVWNVNNGQRFTTYVLEGEAGSGAVVINGAAARLAQEGDRIIIASYASYDEEELRDHRPRIIHVDQNNQPLEA